MDSIFETGSVGDVNMSRGVGPFVLHLSTKLRLPPQGTETTHTRDFHTTQGVRQCFRRTETGGFLKAISKSKGVAFIQVIPC